MLHTSGTPGIDAAGTLPEGFVAQAELAWENVLKILAASRDGAGGHRQDQPVPRPSGGSRRPTAISATRALGDARPASTLLFVPALVWPNMLIEVEIIAAK